MDVKIVFLHGKLEKEVYMEHLKGFIMKEKEEHLSRQKKSLCGLKQAPSSGIRSLSQLWGSRATRKQLLTIVYLCKISLIITLLFVCSK